jgi:long-chain fatty acid transport protein
MMKRTLLFVFFCSVFLAVSAGGFQITLQGIRQQGMGHTGVSLLHGASNNFFNPGSCVFLKSKLQTSAAVNFVFGNAVYYDPLSDYTARTENHVSTPFSFYTNYKVLPKLSLGLAVYTPFGSALEWEKNWKGRFLIQKVDLKVVYIQPTLSYQLTEKLGVGAGLVLGVASINIVKDIPVTSANGRRSYADVEGHARATGVNAGVFYKVSDRVNIGASYRSGLKLDFRDGKTKFQVPFEVRDSFPRGNTFNATLPTPSVVNIGATVNVSSKLMVSGEVNFTQWSAYRDITVDFSKNTTVLEDIYQPRNYRNTNTYRLGVQYTRSCCFAVRAGLAYDHTPVRSDFYSPETPDSDRMIFSTGLSYDFDDHFAIDAAYTLVEGRQVKGTYSPEQFQGVYKFRANIISVGLSYTL